jgi:uncharacterized protein (DUF433 family)
MQALSARRNTMSAMTVPVPSLVYEDEQGTARITGVKTPVKMIVLDHIARGYSPAEIHFQYPYLSLAQIHAALSYYFSHQDKVDAEIDQDEAEADALFAAMPRTITRETLLHRLEPNG